MQVDPKTAPAKTEYKGQTYDSCAPGCTVDFERDPEKYFRGEARTRTLSALRQRTGERVFAKPVPPICV